jgi:hypothetical protein
MQDQYPWLWDVALDNQQFEALLSGRVAVPPHDAQWALVRLIEYAPFSEIRRLLPVARFLQEWPRLAPRVRAKTRREGMQFFYEWLHREPANRA